MKYLKLYCNLFCSFRSILCIWNFR